MKIEEYITLFDCDYYYEWLVCLILLSTGIFSKCDVIRSWCCACTVGVHICKLHIHYTVNRADLGYFCKKG